MFKRCCFKFMPVTVPFSKSTVFKICRQKMCRFRVNRRPIRRIFHRFQNVPASCERSLTLFILAFQTYMRFLTNPLSIFFISGYYQIRSKWKDYVCLNSIIIIILRKGCGSKSNSNVHYSSKATARPVHP